jgi:hypothetical protein
LIYVPVMLVMCLPLLDKAEDLASAAHQSVLERHIVECLQAITHMDAAYG